MSKHVSNDIWNFTVKYIEPGSELEDAIQLGPMTISRRGGIVHQSPDRKRFRRAKWASYRTTSQGDEIMLTCVQLGKGDDRHWHTLETIRHHDGKRPPPDYLFELQPGQRWYTGKIKPIEGGGHWHNGTYHGPG